MCMEPDPKRRCTINQLLYEDSLMEIVAGLVKSDQFRDEFVTRTHHKFTMGKVTEDELAMVKDCEEKVKEFKEESD